MERVDFIDNQQVTQSPRERDRRTLNKTKNHHEECDEHRIFKNEMRPTTLICRV